MVDPEDVAAARHQLEQEDVRRRYRGFAARLERIDAELEKSSDTERLARLQAESGRISELLAETKPQLPTPWDREHVYGGSEAKRIGE